MKNIATALFFFGFLFCLNAQITKVKYLMSYDTARCEYLVSLYVEEGQINSISDRVLFNSQISVVSAEDVSLSLGRVYHPLIGPNGTTPIRYEMVPPTVTPANCSSQKFHRIYPNITPTAYFPEGLSAGDTLALFSLKSDKATVRCGFDIRLYENGVDHDGTDPNLLGNDFSNSFTMGSPTQLYTGNLPQVGSPGPVMTGLDFDLAQNLTLTPHFASRSCGGNNNYVWTGPQGFSSVNQGIFIANFSPAFQGYFQLKAYNKEGCMRDYTIPVFYENQPTPDTAVCPGSSLVLSGAPAEINGIPGSWQAVGNGPGALIAMSGGKALLKISDQAAVGKYGYQYTVDNKSYEISIEVSSIPPVPLSICPICEGDTLALPTPPSMTWQTDYNPLVFDSYEVVKIIGDSRAAAVKSGNALLQLKNDTTGCISKPLPVKVLPSKVSLVGNSTTVCVNSTFQFLPSTGGTWTSDSPSVATINNSGVATAIAEGQVTFTYRPVVPVCGMQLHSPVITVIGNSGVAFTGPNSICIGGTTTLSPTSGGTWVSANSGIATVNNQGLVTGVAAGTTTFSFTNNSTGCTSHLQTPVIVSLKPQVQLLTNDTLCVYDIGYCIPSTGGTWASSNPTVVTITNGGVITATSAGTASLFYTQTNAGCISDPLKLVVLPEGACAENGQKWVHVICFADLNGDGNYSPPTEYPLNNTSLQIAAFPITFFTNLNGEAFFPLDTGSYSLTALVPYGNWENNPTITNFYLTENTELLIGFMPIAGSSSAIAQQATGIMRCNQYTNVNVSVMNVGSIPLNGKITVQHEERSMVKNFNPALLSMSDSTITWQIAQLLPGQVFKPSYQARIPNPISNNDSLHFTIRVYDANDSLLFAEPLAYLIRCSYDPNDLQVRPDRIGEENLTLRSEALTYQVRFQNTGNDTAFYVRIDDVLHKDIDRRSLMLIDASHKGRMILCSNDTLCYIMDTIQLVDDKTNYEASQGYVVFTTKTKFDIAEGTVVPNQALIFFDANVPVITNAVKNTIVTSLPCPDNALTQDGPWLVAKEGGNQYTWIDCSNDQILEVSDVPLYKPEQNGSYRVAVKGDYCTVESACISFVVNSITEIDNDLLIYPTLVNDLLYIQSEQAIEKITLGALSGVLHTLPSQLVGNNLLSVTLPAVASGYYVVTVVTKGGVYTRAVVKM
ncbi:MAG: Ig-like domain-containing protein [Saprospiraceae bacterium]|nr:Ig-like domain-containing protein [Saprospiraceae bacterium]